MNKKYTGIFFLFFLFISMNGFSTNYKNIELSVSEIYMKMKLLGCLFLLCSVSFAMQIDAEKFKVPDNVFETGIGINFWKPEILSHGKHAAGIDKKNRTVMHYIAKFGWQNDLPPLLREFSYSIRVMGGDALQISFHFPAFIGYEMVVLWTEDESPKDVHRNVIYLRVPKSLTHIGKNWLVNTRLGNLVLDFRGEIDDDFTAEIYYLSRLGDGKVKKISARLNPNDIFRLRDFKEDKREELVAEEDFLPIVDPDVKPGEIQRGVGIGGLLVEHAYLPPNPEDSWWEFTTREAIHSDDKITRVASYDSVPDPELPPQRHIHMWPRVAIKPCFERSFPPKKLLRATASYQRNAKDDYGYTPLCCAIVSGQSTASMRAPVLFNELTYDGKTPIHLAAIHSDVETLRQLLECGGAAVINARDNYGNTALHYAAIHKKIDDYALLKQSGARETIYNFEGKTPADLLTQD